MWIASECLCFISEGTTAARRRRLTAPHPRPCSGPGRGSREDPHSQPYGRNALEPAPFEVRYCNSFASPRQQRRYSLGEGRGTAQQRRIIRYPARSNSEHSAAAARCPQCHNHWLCSGRCTLSLSKPVMHDSGPPETWPRAPRSRRARRQDRSQGRPES